MNYGKKTWLIADGYWESQSNGTPSHDALCVLNTSDTDAQIELIIYFEDDEPLTGFSVTCKARRTNHIRMDKLTNKKGLPIPKDKPYAILATSNVEIVAQYSRLVTAQPEMALMTTIGYGE